MEQARPPEEITTSRMACQGYTLYLPGKCIHAMPLFPQSTEELHWPDDDSPPGLTHRRYVDRPKDLFDPIADHPAFNTPPTIEEYLEHPSAILRGSSPDFFDAEEELNAVLQRLNLPTIPRQAFAMHSEPSSPVPKEATLPDLAKLIIAEKAFENTSTSVAASQMRNALNNLADTVEDPTEKKVSRTNLRLESVYLMAGSSSRLRWTISSLSSEDT